MRTCSEWLIERSRWIILSLFLLCTLFPFYWMFVTSLKTRYEIYGNLTLCPTHLTLSNYVDAITTSNFGTYFFNSIVVTIVSSRLVLIVSMPGGYSLSRYHFKGKKFVRIHFLATQMIFTKTSVLPPHPISYIGLHNLHGI